MSETLHPMSSARQWMRMTAVPTEQSACAAAIPVACAKRTPEIGSLGITLPSTGPDVRHGAQAARRFSVWLVHRQREHCIGAEISNG
jgi:hypothetical protein